MMSAAQLGLTAQDVADLVAFLSRNLSARQRRPAGSEPPAALVRPPTISLDPIYQVIDS